MLLFFIGLLCAVGSAVHCHDLPTPGGPGWGIPGGHFPITKQEELDELKGRLVASFGELKSSHADHPEFEEVTIEQASYQVVAGTIYAALVTVKENGATTKCTLELYEKPWLKYKKFDVSCGEPKRTYQLVVGKSDRRKRRQTLGGTNEISIEEGTKILEDALKEINAEHNAGLVLVAVEKADYQSVQGTKHTIVAKLTVPGWTDTCTVKVWNVSWQNFSQIDMECKEGKKYSVTKGKLADR